MECVLSYRTFHVAYLSKPTQIDTLNLKVEKKKIFSFSFSIPESGLLRIMASSLLSQVYQQKIQQNDKDIKTWLQYKQSHEKIIDGLQTLVAEVSLNCLVPLGKRAFMYGKLTHTNEIMACIGSDYFVKYSSQQAISLCHRRIKKSNEMLEKLEKERKLLETRQMFPFDHGAFVSDNCENPLDNIYWDDKELEEWRVKHKMKEKDYRKKLMDSKQQENDETPDSDLFQKLDQLELEEELNNELKSLREEKTTELNLNEEKIDYVDIICNNKENPDVSVEKKNSDNQCTELLIESNEKTNSFDVINVEKDNEKLEKIVDNIYSYKDTKINGKFEVSIINEEELKKTIEKPNSNFYSAFNNLVEKKHKTEDTFLTNISQDSGASNVKKENFSKRVSFAEPFIDEKRDNYEDQNKKVSSDINSDESDDTIKIDVTHTDIETSVLESTNGEILSPKDIYKIFYKPKSILKQSYNSSYIDKKSLTNFQSDDNDSHEVPNIEYVNKFSTNFLLQDIQERDVNEKPSDVNEVSEKQRPVSKFKLERAKLKK